MYLVMSLSLEPKG